MTNPTFPTDQNGNAIPVLAPRSGETVTLTDAGAEALSADTTTHRTVRLLANDTGVQVGVGDAANYSMQLMQGAAEFIKLEPSMKLYAKGSGTLNITIMG